MKPDTVSKGVDDLWIDLSDIKLEDLELLTQEGARGIPEFAASTGNNGNSCDPPDTYPCCCCGMEDPAEGVR